MFKSPVIAAGLPLSSWPMPTSRVSSGTCWSGSGKSWAGTRHDFTMFSAMDNMVREQVTEFYRIHSTVTFIQMGMDHHRIKSAMGVPDTTFERCRRLAANPWMMQHIERNEISLTNAHLLLGSRWGQGRSGCRGKLEEGFRQRGRRGQGEDHRQGGRFSGSR